MLGGLLLREWMLSVWLFNGWLLGGWLLRKEYRGTKIGITHLTFDKQKLKFS